MMKKKYYHLLVCLSFAFNGLSQTTTFNYTGGVQTYTVPAGVSSIQIEARGAQGGGPFGGNGGQAVGTFSVVPGTVYQIYVGGIPGAQLGPGGFNGGGSILTLPCGGGDGWPGGGASDVRLTSALADRIIVAGGGGGQGWSNGTGGAGGGITGGDGVASWIANTHGKGATASAGGIGGFYSGNGGTAPSGTFGVGGNSSPLDTYCTGGAGGGGWYGGGGGYVSAGGGGSSYISYPGTTNPSTASGTQAGNGIVIVTVLCSSINPTVSATSLCEGNSVTLSATSANGGTITWNNGVVNGVSFVPAAGTLTYTATSSAGQDCGFSTDITVNTIPVADAGADQDVCMGDEVALTATGTGTFSWNNGVDQATPFVPSITATYTVTVDNGSCTATDDVVVTVNEVPAADAGTDQEICNGEQVILTAAGSGTFSWDNGVDQGTPFSPGITTTYTVTVDNGFCTATDEVNVIVNDLPTVDAGSDQQVCMGDEVTVTATGTGMFSWNNGVNQAVPFTPAATITYTVTADNGSCTAADNVTVTVVTVPAATADLSGVSTLTAGPAGQTYQWINCATGTPVSGANAMTFVATANGSYQVVVTNTSECSDTSACVNVTTLGIDESAALEGISFTPNPTNGQVIIAMPAAVSGTVSVFDAQGKLVLKAAAVENGSSFSLSNVQSGIYMIHIQTVNGLGMSRIIKN